MDSVTYTEIEHLEHVLTEALMDEWDAQGHRMTGAVIREIEYQVEQKATELILSGFMPFYGNIIAAGTKASRIPYSGRTNKGGTSKYIQALQSYAQTRMNITDEKKSLSIAFAIAATQKKEGMPTSGSYKYSSNGKRKDWVESAFKTNEDKISEAISEMASNIIEVHFDVILAKWQLLINEEVAA